MNQSRGNGHGRIPGHTHLVLGQKLQVETLHRRGRVAGAFARHRQHKVKLAQRSSALGIHSPNVHGRLLHLHPIVVLHLQRCRRPS